MRIFNQKLWGDVFFYLTIAFGVYVFLPQLDTYGLVASGDQGICLYAFDRTLHGEMPYKDYLWIYGPLLPFYYAFFLKIFGINMLSILKGQVLFKFLSGIFIFLTLRTLSFSFIGFAGALWFYVFRHNFFYTYNHDGGIFVLTIFLWMIASYIRYQRNGYLWLALFCAFILALIKINIGAVAGGVLLLTVILTDFLQGIKWAPGKKKFYIAAIGILPITVAAIYSFLLRGLSWVEINQCLPYFGAYQPYHISLFAAVVNRFLRLLRDVLTDPRQLFFTMTVIFSFVRTIQMIRNKQSSLKERNMAILIVVIFGVYYALNLHEYLMSGVWYRGYWTEPVGIVWMFSVIAMGLKRFNGIIRGVIVGIIVLIAVVSQGANTKEVKDIHRTEHYMDDPRAKIFIQNDADWIKTVQDTTGFLNLILAPNETFFAFPYDPLYYYLANRKSPTRLLNFIEMNHVTSQQEVGIIQDLERNHVNFILLTNRIRSHASDIGYFGVTYSRILAKYMAEKFVPVKSFGNWDNEGGYQASHATLILRRKEPL
ncbi:MAG: hypothetical protein HQL15_02445 [Candidatus Omnitrophica bacterium]|nr:hypothetical protein [Candidatus Omnitrophota bacterium]